MSKIRAKIGAGLLALTASFAIISAGTANTADASVCDDGYTLVDYYAGIGDDATALAILANLRSMGWRWRWREKPLRLQMKPR